MYKDIGRERHYVVDVKIFREEKVVGTSFGHKSITSCFWKKKSLLQKTGGALARARSSTRHTTKKKLVPPFCKASGLLLCSFKTLGTFRFILSTFQVYALIWDLNFKVIILHINLNGDNLLQHMKYLKIFKQVVSHSSTSSSNSYI